MYPQSEILFPHRCVSSLGKLRGPEWENLVERIAVLPESHIDALAFSLMMIKMDKCLKCDLGSYKASLGCCACAQRAIKSYKKSDHQLIKKFHAAKRELSRYLENNDVNITIIME